MVERSEIRFNRAARILAGLTLLVLAAGISAAAAQASEARVAVVPRSTRAKKHELRNAIRYDVKMVLVPVTVTDPFGAPYSGLPPQSFRVFEGGVEQKIKYFAAEDAPVSMGVIFDASRSMEDKVDQSRAAVVEFFRMAMPGDDYFLVEFNDAPRLLCNFTSNPDEIAQSLSGIQPKNWTALLDAVYMGIHHLKRAKNHRKALLILSDGGDNNSRYTESEMKTLVREADVCIYSIALVGSGLFRRHVPLLRKLTEETGGQLCEVSKLKDLPQAVAKINAAIRHQYLIGYSSTNAQNDGMYRKVEVRLTQPPDVPRLRASWRTGYYAPVGLGN